MPTYWAGGVEGDWDYIAIDLLGASLDNIYRQAGGPAQVMDLGSVCCIAMQMVSPSPPLFHQVMTLTARLNDYNSCMHVESSTATSSWVMLSWDYIQIMRPSI